jgi:hypothetical protein
MSGRSSPEAWQDAFADPTPAASAGVLFYRVGATRYENPQGFRTARLHDKGFSQSSTGTAAVIMPRAANAFRQRQFVVRAPGKQPCLRILMGM